MPLAHRKSRNEPQYCRQCLKITCTPVRGWSPGQRKVSGTDSQEIGGGPPTSTPSPDFTPHHDWEDIQEPLCTNQSLHSAVIVQGLEAGSEGFQMILNVNFIHPHLLHKWGFIWAYIKAKALTQQLGFGDCFSLWTADSRGDTLAVVVGIEVGDDWKHQS